MENDILIISKNLEYEERSDWEVAVAASNGTVTFYKLFTITANPRKEDRWIELNKTDIDENEPAGTVIGTFSTENGEEKELFVYSFVEGYEDNKKFKIFYN